MREYQLCGLGHAIVDIFVEVSDAEFAALGFERGSMRLVDVAEQRMLLERFHGQQPRLVSGGSVANSVIAFTQLGGSAAFISCVGDDRYGLFYHSEFEELDIDIGNPVIVDQTTGTCVCLITPDAERTMRTCLSVASQLAARHVDEQRIKNSDWLFVEGYMFANVPAGQEAIREAIRLARKHGTRVAVTCSDAFVINAFSDPFRAAVSQADLLFANETEACALAGTRSADAAFAKLQGTIPSLVVTHGPHGVYVRHAGVEAHVPAFPCEPKDLTGAGDMLAGAFLYGITHDVPADKAARAACFLASKVITQVGARLHHGTRSAWDECLRTLQGGH
jgi:sugar/nucleoside kinase (ribokinase family)